VDLGDKASAARVLSIARPYFNMKLKGDLFFDAILEEVGNENGFPHRLRAFLKSRSKKRKQ
jgi:hypothetical protein